jgi:serine/threonine protein kinase/tetratricopeptide (TPR) repeat protein
MDIEERQDSWTGRTVSHYRLLAELGRGGMGVVYKAQDLLLERLVALKFLGVGREGEVPRQRLLQEARAASSLDHPNVCTIYEADQDGEGNLFIAMRLCEGETFKARIAGGPMALDQALDLTSQVAAGLAHAHDQGIVHRDIKPANLILTFSGQVKIVDFGIALQPDGPRLTREGAVVGTLAYMSPEQLLGHPVDHRADLWSLGVILYELLTCCLPFGSAASPAYAGAGLSMNPNPVTNLRAELPAAIEPLFARMLAKDPARRYQKADEVIRELQKVREGGSASLSFAAVEPTVSIASAVLPPHRPKRPALEVNPHIAQISVGRQEELSLLARHLLPEPAEMAPAAVCAIQGMPGVGKSFLADRFALDRAERFEGGYLRIILDPKSPASPEDLLDELADRLKLAGGEDLVDRVRERLRYPRTLLHIENVDSPAAEVAAGRLLHQFPGSTAIVTGRLRDLGRALGWHPIRLAPFDEETALRQLWGELGWEPVKSEENDHRELVQVLGYLPLALHLAAGHLRSGRSAPGFLRTLRQRRLALRPADGIELVVGVFEEARKVLATSFSLSLELLREELGLEADRLLAGLRALGHAPLSGFGRSLGAAIAGLQDDDFEELVFHAQKLGILIPVSRQERPDGAWRLHPLFGEFLASAMEVSTVIDRMTEWFLIRFPEGRPGQEADQGRRWSEIQLENAALIYWLPRLPAADRPRVQEHATYYARRNGPFHLWIEFCETALRELTEPVLRSEFLWTLSLVALRHGLLEKALESAQEKLALDSGLGDEYEISVSLGLIGDVLQARGSFDEAISVWKERQLPILEKRGETRERAMSLCKVAYVLHLRERFEEALTILREEALPAFEAAGDIRSRAVVLGMVADILQAQGNLGTALRIRQTEELPIYEMLGEPRSTAVTIGKIATILHARGEHEEALQILQQEKSMVEALGEMRELAVCLGRIAEVLHSLRRIDEAIRARRSEQIPILQRLGSPYDLVFAQKSLALLCLERREPGDQEEAGELLRRALEYADRLRLPVADDIRSLLAENGF